MCSSQQDRNSVPDCICLSLLLVVAAVPMSRCCRYCCCCHTVRSNVLKRSAMDGRRNLGLILIPLRWIFVGVHQQGGTSVVILNVAVVIIVFVAADGTHCQFVRWTT